MDVHVRSHSSYLTYSIKDLVSEIDIGLIGNTQHLLVIDFSSERNYFSMIELISERAEWLAKPETKVIIIGDRDVYGGVEQKSIIYIRLNASLEEWRKKLKAALQAPALNVSRLITMAGRANYEALTSSEKDVIACIRTNMCMGNIIARQGITTKTYYARIYSIKRKLSLRSAREVYLNIEKIYNKIKQISDQSKG
ncbi:hypothetical protein [Enterobacter sp. 638]|nr:hypothetical protein [Enterobacter sp. 638]